MRAEDVREVDVRQLQQPVPVGVDRGVPELREGLHPGGVLVGQTNNVVRLGDRRRVQGDVPVRGAHHDGAGAAHDDTAATAADAASTSHTRQTRLTPTVGISRGTMQSLQ